MGKRNYYCAASAAEAVQLLQEAGEHGMFLAGGTDVLVRMNQYDFSKDIVLIGIEDIPELKRIEEENGRLHIGSAVTARELMTSDVVRKYAGAIYEAARESANPQVRNKATIGGNVGTASPSGDLLTALIALEAEAVIVNENGERTIPVKDVPVFVKKTCLGKTDLIREFVIPVKQDCEESAFLKMGKRKAVTISIVSVAARVKLSADGRTIEKVSAAAGACAPTPVRLSHVEEKLTGAAAERAIVEEAAKSAAEDVSPITDMRGSSWYRKDVVQVFAARAIWDAIEKIRKEGSAQ